MTEQVLIPVLTFVVGLLIGLFYKYSDIVAMKKDIKTLQESISVANIVELTTSVKTMSTSLIFDQHFQQQLSTVCAEHGDMRSKIETDGTRITKIEAKTGLSDCDGRERRTVK